MERGRRDVISIVKDSNTGRYHVYVLCESPLPGQGEVPVEQLEFIRLKSTMHHTSGAETYEGALEQLAQMREKILIRDENVWSSPDQVLERDCSEGFAGVFFTRPWHGRPEIPKLAPIPLAH